MDSRIFIRQATSLIEEIKTFKKSGNRETEGTALQKEITATFSGLQNPTLPSAEKLRDAALDAGFNVNPQVSQRITQANYAWGN